MWKHHGDDAWVIWGVLDVALPLQELEDKPLGGQREKLWCDFFLDPLQWWDHRSKKLGGHKCKMWTLKDAWRVTFNQMLSRDVVSWSTMILGHVKCRQGQKALEVFQ
ncbi:hypothetical protein BDL97_20G005600 [Sphagnum fallax]|nr:hypothetical protein BDL97_20G005600 [Sphagnum fallax]